MEKIVVIDIGTYETKFGLNDQTTPDKFQTVFSNRYPLVRSKTMKMSDYELIFDKIYSKLGVESSQYGVLLGECVQYPTMIKEKLTKLLFEKYDIPCLNVTTHCILNLFAWGDTTGLSVDCGEGLTQIVPVYDGYAMGQALTKMNLGGIDVDKEFILALKERKIPITSFEEKEWIKKIKVEHCYVAQDFKGEVRRWKEEKHCESDVTLPDGNTINIGVEKFRAGETLYSTGHLDVDTVPQSIKTCISKSYMDVRKDLWGNIILSGGNSKMKGFKDRLTKELGNPKICPKKELINVEYHPEKYPVFTGGCTLSTLHSFKNEVVTKILYEESGAKQIHKIRRIKFF